MNIPEIEHKDPRFCCCHNKDTYCPLRHFNDQYNWCALGYFKSSSEGNAVFDTSTDKIVAIDVDFNDYDALNDEWFGTNRYEFVVKRPQICINKHGL